METEFFDDNKDDNTDTKAWALLLRVSYPVWDGGAGSAAVKAARFEAEQATAFLDRDYCAGKYATSEAAKSGITETLTSYYRKNFPASRCPP